MKVREAMAKVESFCRSRLNGCGPETRQPVETALQTLRRHLEEEAGKEQKATLVNVRVSESPPDNQKGKI